jgi:dihydrofolate reductase
MYEVMSGWETDPTVAAQSPVTRDFAALRQAADKLVYSRTLETVATARTRIEREFDPEAVRHRKLRSSTDLMVGGPELASQAFKAGLVDQCHLFVSPILVGGGKRCLPHGVRLLLELLSERRFGHGVVYVAYCSGAS